MPRATFHFPKGFLWGTATSAYQVEGNNFNTNWSEWEMKGGHIAGNQRSGSACEWWSGRWKEDLNRSRDNGQNAHRLSIEWSRVQPKIDHWNENALDVYREIAMGCFERGITPIITLHHFTEPLWITEIGGWENPGISHLFADYVRHTVEALKDYTNYWITINEPNVYIFEGYLEGVFPPGKQSIKSAFKVMVNMLRSHAKAYEIIREIQPNARVGIATNYRAFWPDRKLFPPDVWITKLIDYYYNRSFVETLQTGRFINPSRTVLFPEVKNTLDFIGLNYYTGEYIRIKPFNQRSFFHSRYSPPEADVSENGFIANVPEGITKAINWAAQFKKPIIITENGIEDSKDLLRPRYLVEHIHKVWKLVNLNVPIKGYFYWTLVDNFEWERGWNQRFGLYALDTDSQARIPRQSLKLYKSICENNCLSYEMVNEFAPSVINKLFP